MIGLVFIGSGLSQEPKISLGLSGLGKKGEVYIAIHNIGDTAITDINISIDGEYYKTIRGKSNPRKGFETVLSMDPGKHKVEVISPEGAYESLVVNVPNVPEQEEIPEPEQPYKNKTFIIIGTVILVVGIWLLIKPRRLKLD